jgi:hypothetical protein
MRALSHCTTGQAATARLGADGGVGFLASTVENVAGAGTGLVVSAPRVCRRRACLLERRGWSTARALCRRTPPQDPLAHPGVVVEWGQVRG